MRRVRRSRESAVISPVRTWCASRLANATMSSRPSAAGWCPPSSRDRRRLARQRHGRADGVPGGVGGRPAAAQGQVLGRPPLDGLAQPPLADAGEVQLAGQPEHLKLPDVPGPLLLRPATAGSTAPPSATAAAGGHRSGLSAPGTWARSSTLPARRACSSLTRQRVEVGRVRSPASVRRCSPASSSAITRSGRPRSDDLVPGHVRRGGMPRPLGQDRAAVIAAMAAPRDAVSAAQSGAVRRRGRARRHDAGPERGQRPDLRPGQPRLGRQATDAAGAARCGWRTAAHPTHPGAGSPSPGKAGPRGTCRRRGGRGSPPMASSLAFHRLRHVTHRSARLVRGGGGAAGHRAFPQAEQRVTAHRGEDLRHGIPARPGQEVRPQHAPQDGQLIAGCRVRIGNRSQLRGHRRTS